MKKLRLKFKLKVYTYNKYYDGVLHHNQKIDNKYITKIIRLFPSIGETCFPEDELEVKTIDIEVNTRKKSMVDNIFFF